MAPRRRWRAAVLAVLMGGVLALSAASAQAVTTHMYDNFTTCPTTSPEMNEPTSEGVICVSTLVQGGLMRVGNFQASITSPLHVQFAGVEKEEKLLVIPGTTTLEAAPFTVPNPLAADAGTAAVAAKASSADPANPAILALTRALKSKEDKKAKKQKKQKHKKHHKKKHHKKKKKKVTPVPVPAPTTPVPTTPAPLPSPTPPPTPVDPLIHIAVEPVGNLEELEIGGILGGEKPFFKMGTRLHLTGFGLGDSCYIGTPAEPIELQPHITFPPSSFNLGQDPNGFTVEVLSLGGFSMEDDEFTVPGASGCGVTPGSLDQTIDEAIGLPSISGGSKILFANVLLDMVGAIFDGTPPKAASRCTKHLKRPKTGPPEIPAQKARPSGPSAFLRPDRPAGAGPAVSSPTEPPCYRDRGWFDGRTKTRCRRSGRWPGWRGCSNGPPVT